MVVEKKLIVTEDEVQMRLDVFIAKRMELTRSHARKIIETIGVCQVIRGESHRLLKQAGRHLNLGMEFISPTIPPEDESIKEQEKPQSPPLNCLYEDDEIIVLEKPSGWVMYEEHPSSIKEARYSVADFLASHCGEALSSMGGTHRRGIVHRLDKDTSGLVVVAKNNAAHEALAQQWKRGGIERHYVGFLYNSLSSSHGMLDGAIGRDPHDRIRRAVMEDGNPACTHYIVEAVYGEDAPLASKVKFRLETGRTHQIRVHCAHANCPVIGDNLYGKSHEARRILERRWRMKTSFASISPYELASATPMKRQALHAASLGFRHPVSDKVITHTMSMPKDMTILQSCLEELLREES